MALTSRAKILGIRCNRYLRRALPGDAPVKRLADVLGQSHQTAARIFTGDTPTSGQLTALAAHFGKDFVAYVFEPLAGEMRSVSAGVTLSHVEELLLSLRPLGPEPGPRPPPARPDAAVVSKRLPLSHLTYHPSLLPSLERFRERAGRAELPLAIAEARADSAGRMSVNRQRRGDVLRFAYRSRASPIHAPNEPAADRPVASLADPAYAQITLSFCEETARSGEPALTRNQGTILKPDGARAFVDLVVLWAAYRARDGELIFTAHSEPGGRRERDV